MKKNLIVLVGVALLGVLTVAPLAMAGTTECTSNLTGPITGNVDVPAGATCFVGEGKITGNVTVEGALVVLFSTITGNLQGNHAAGLFVGFTTINGNLQADQTSGDAALFPASLVCGSTIHGDVQIQGSGAGAPWVIGDICGPNAIGGNLEFHNNAAPGNILGNTVGNNLQFNNNVTATVAGDISGNTITGNLACQNNVQPPTGTGNKAKQKSGQCAAF